MSQRRRDTLPKNRKTAAKLSASQRRISRREREERKRKQLYIGLAAAAVLSVAIVAGFALNEYIFKPRAVLASVNGVEIRRRDYWKVRSVDLINQVNQYQQFAQMVDASQQQQYLQLAQQAATELEDIWGSTSLDDATLTRMIDDQIFLQNADEIGVSITDQDVDDYIISQFQPSDAPIFTPTPEPTLIPQRAEWATQTEIALQGGEPEASLETPAGVEGSPAANGSPSGAVATPVNNVATTVTSPVGSPVDSEASPVSSPDGSFAGSPLASPAGSPEATPATSAARDSDSENFPDRNASSAFASATRGLVLSWSAA